MIKYSHANKEEYMFRCDTMGKPGLVVLEAHGLRLVAGYRVNHPNTGTKYATYYTNDFTSKQLVELIPQHVYVKGLLMEHPIALLIRKRGPKPCK